MTRDVACLIVEQVVQAVAFLHASEVVHRNITSGNVLLVDFSLASPIAKLSEFAMNCHLDAGQHDRTPCREISEYRAPEQYSSSYAERVDVYALGIFMYEIFSMKHAFDTFPTHLVEELFADENPAGPRVRSSRGVSFDDVHPTPCKRLAAPEKKKALQWAAKQGWRPDVGDLEDLCPGLGELLQECWSEFPEARPSAASLVERLRIHRASIWAPGHIRSRRKQGLSGRKVPSPLLSPPPLREDRCP